jgi:hypothetical protein
VHVVLVHHYGKLGLCRALGAHDKGKEAHGNRFAMRFPLKRMAKAAQQFFARQRVFVVRYLSIRTANLCPAQTFLK